MKSRIPYAAAALLAAGGISLAFAQKDQDVRSVDTQANPKAPSAMSDANVPNTRADVNSSGVAAAGKKANPAPPMNFVQEPVATPSGQGSQDPVVASIVNALNADQSLQHSKISVQSDQGTVVLTGVTLTQAQKKQAVQIAASQAGPAKVVDAMQSDDV